MNEAMTTESGYQERFGKYREEARQKTAEVDALLSDGSGEAIRQLITLFTDSTFMETTALADAELFQIKMLVWICVEEVQTGVTSPCISQIRSVREFDLFWRKLKFLLWRIEFGGEDAASDDFYDMMQERQLSAEVLYVLLCTASINRQEMYLVCIGFLMKHQDLNRSFALLKHAVRDFPENVSLQELYREFERVV